MASVTAVTIDQIMDVFDSEAEIVRGYIRSAASAEFDRQLACATRLLSRKLREPYPGTEWGVRALRWLEQCSGGSPEGLARLVEVAWQEAWDDGPDPACRGCARDAARRRWEIVWPEFENGGGTLQATRTVPSLAFAMTGPFLEIACPVLSIESAGTGGLAQRIEETRSRHEQIRSALGLMLGNEKLRTGDIDLVASAADLGTVAFAARDAGELADNAGALAMPGLLAAVGIGAVAVAVADVGSTSRAQREQVAFGHLARCREAAQREFLREADGFLAFSRSIMHARAKHVYSARRVPERLIRVRQGISELLGLGDEMLKASDND